jgi:hypothetical protein
VFEKKTADRMGFCRRLSNLPPLAENGNISAWAASE